MQYNRYVIAAACMKYLEDGNYDHVTITTSVAEQTVTATLTAAEGEQEEAASTASAPVETGGNDDDEPEGDPSIPYGDEFIAPSGLPMTCLPWDFECKAKLAGGGEVSPEIQQAQYDYEYGNPGGL